MPISSLASLLPSGSAPTDDFYHRSCFQAFVAGVEETLLEQLEERLLEISAIATSRVSVTATDLLCDLTLDALTRRTQQPIVMSLLTPSTRPRECH